MSATTAAPRRRLGVPGPDGTIPTSNASSPLHGSADSDHDGYPNGVDCAPHDASVHPGATNRPDLGFADTNCDGIDGEAARAVFVSPSGSDANPGSLARPLRTLAAANTAADARDKDVHAGTGTYDEELRLASRVSVYGGYGTSWKRSLSTVTRILGARNAEADSEGALALNITAAGRSSSSRWRRARPAGSAPARTACAACTALACGSSTRR
jgi:hypothetical protein